MIIISTGKTVGVANQANLAPRNGYLLIIITYNSNYRYKDIHNMQY